MNVDLVSNEVTRYIIKDLSRLIMSVGQMSGQ